MSPFQSKFGITKQGIKTPSAVYWNLHPPHLYEESLRRGEGILSKGGALVVLTGEHTGRSANDKYFVKEAESQGNIWWSSANVSIERENYAALKSRVLDHFNGGDVFVQDPEAH